MSTLMAISGGFRLVRCLLIVDSLDSYWQIPFVECHRAALFISVCCDENTGLKIWLHPDYKKKSFL
jgi:hypothetical protein